MPSLAEKLIKQGEERGKIEGEKRGEIKGIIKGKQDLLIRLLRRKFGLLSSDEKTIRSVTDEAMLHAKSKDEIFKILVC